MKKKLFITLLLVVTTALTTWGQSSKNGVKPILPVPSQAQVEWQKMETYAFIHFGLNTFVISKPFIRYASVSGT